MIRRTTWVILILFVVLLGVVWILQRGEQTELETTPTAGAMPLFSFQEGAIQGFRVQQAEGDAVELERSQEGSWSLVEPKPGEPVDESRASSAATSLASLSVLSTLKENPPLDAIGLEPPEYTITVNLEDGSQQVINVGQMTPIKSGYYLIGADKAVKVVSQFGLESILGLVGDPPIVKSTATPEPVSETPEEESGTPEPVQDGSPTPAP